MTLLAINNLEGYKLALSYHVSLYLVAIVVGLVYLATHLPGVIAPEPYTRFVKSLPRNYALGVVLTLAAGAWLTILTATTDLGEMSPMRQGLLVAWVTGTVLAVLFLRVFLAVRGLAMLMLLSVGVMLDSAFLVDSNTRLVVTVLAYVWAVAGIALVASPYLLRDLFDLALKDAGRTRAACGAGAVLGAVLLLLGLFVYPNVV